jgi:hypothetical protein
MRCRILKIVSALCLAACFVLALVWLRSYYVADRIVANPWGSQRLLLGAKQGRLVAVVFNWPPQPLCAPGLFSYVVGDDLAFPIGDARQYDAALGFAVLRNPQYMVGRSTFETPTGGTIYISGASSATLHGWDASVPFWFLVLSTAVAGIVLRRERPWRFSIRGLFIAVTIIAVVFGLVVALDKPAKNWQLDQPVPLDDL